MGQTKLGTFTKQHLYTCGRTGVIAASNKIFIEVKKPKGRFIIDDGVDAMAVESVCVCEEPVGDNLDELCNP